MLPGARGARRRTRRVAHGAQLDEVVVVDREADDALTELGLDRFDEIDDREVVGVEVFAQAGVER